jgi:hypothetical protein
VANDESIGVNFTFDAKPIRDANTVLLNTSDVLGRMDTAATRFTSSGTRAGMIAFQLGQAATDMSYGLAYGMNNLSMIASLMGMGGAFGIAMQFGIAGAELLARNWGAVARAFHDGRTEIEKATDAVKEFDAAGGVTMGGAGAFVRAQRLVATDQAGGDVLGMFGKTPSGTENTMGSSFMSALFGDTPLGDQEAMLKELVDAFTDLTLMQMGFPRGDRNAVPGIWSEIEKKTKESMKALLGRAKLGDQEAIEDIARILDAVGDRRAQSIRLAARSAQMTLEGYDTENARDQAESARRMQRNRDVGRAAANPLGGSMGGIPFMGGIERERLDPESDQQMRATREAARQRNEHRREEDRILEQRQRDRIRHAMGRTGDMTQELAGAVASQTLGRQYGGQGLDFRTAFMRTREELERRLTAPRSIGGMGMNADDGGKMASQMMGAALPFAEDMANAMRTEFPRSVQEFKEAVGEQIKEFQRFRREGIAMALGEVR